MKAKIGECWTRHQDLRGALAETMPQVRQQAHDCFAKLRDVFVATSRRR